MVQISWSPWAMWPSGSLSNGWIVGETMRRLAKDLGDQGRWAARCFDDLGSMTIQKPGVWGGDPMFPIHNMYACICLRDFFFEYIYLKHRKLYRFG